MLIVRIFIVTLFSLLDVKLLKIQMESIKNGFQTRGPAVSQQSQQESVVNKSNGADDSDDDVDLFGSESEVRYVVEIILRA